MYFFRKKLQPTSDNKYAQSHETNVIILSGLLLCMGNKVCFKDQQINQKNRWAESNYLIVKKC